MQAVPECAGTRFRLFHSVQAVFTAVLECTVCSRVCRQWMQAMLFHRVQAVGAGFSRVRW